MNRTAPLKTLASAACLLAALTSLALALSAAVDIHFVSLDQPLIEARLQSPAERDVDRGLKLKELFLLGGCPADQLSELPVPRLQEPNIRCTVPGKTPRIILVGAHYDHNPKGQGVVDNWSGASLLPSLVQSLAGQQREHTFVFLEFSGEEKGLLGSKYYAKQLTKEQRKLVAAMVNLDSLGLGPANAWTKFADPKLLSALAAVSAAMNIPVTGVNFEQVGSTDSVSFSERGIPTITIHSVTQDTWKILHSSKDQLSAVKIDDYYRSYRLVAAYLAYLDGFLDEKPAEN